MKKRIISIFLILTMMFTWIPLTASAAEPEEVYISISFDGQYIGDKNNNPIAYTAVSLDELATVDLTEYGLSDYLYDADGDGNYEITALHLYVYTHENIFGGDWSNVEISGGPGAIFFESGLFGFEDCNLRYDYNGVYPAVDGWGLTADQIVLSDGDFLDMAAYTSWSFYWDSATGFHYFADSNGDITHSYNVKSGSDLQVKLVRAYSDFSVGGTVQENEAGYEISYGLTYGTPMNTITTDDNGCANITFPSTGTWYVWCDGSYGNENPTDIVSSPAYAKVTVTAASSEPDNPKDVYVEAVEAKIDAIGTVTYDSKTTIEEARSAYDALSEEQKKLVENYDVLTAAESTLASIDKDIAAANVVEAKIDAMGTVDVHSGSKVRAARKAYNALSNTQKSYVKNFHILTAAENVLEELYTEAAKADHLAIYNATGKYISSLGTPSVGSVGGEWMVINLTRSGYACPEGYYKNVVDYVNAKINKNEQLHKAKSTDNSRVILALTSAGYDVTDVDGHNLLMGLTDMTYVKKQGINGPIWALIAFDCHGYEIPTNPNVVEQVTREGLISYILEKQLDDGGWALSGTVADPDMTGMALQALAPYYKTNTEVKAAVDEALELLSNRQLDNGGYGSIDGACSESSAQVIVALTALGINPETDPRFVKNGVSVMDAMCLFAIEGGGFAHIPNGGLNGMATEQGQYALAAYFRFLDNKTSLYDMSDVTIRTNTPDNTDEDAANAVEKLISDIGTVTKDSKTTIDTARSAYDALTNAQKGLVKNYSVLTAAESRLAELNKESSILDPNTPDSDKDNNVNQQPNDSDKDNNVNQKPNDSDKNDSNKENNSQQKPDSSHKVDSPQTGDNSNIGLYFVIMLVSALGVVTLKITDKKRRISRR